MWGMSTIHDSSDSSRRLPACAVNGLTSNVLQLLEQESDDKKQPIPHASTLLSASLTLLSGRPGPSWVRRSSGLSVCV